MGRVGGCTAGACRHSVPVDGMRRPSLEAGRERQTRGDPGTQSHGTHAAAGTDASSQPGCRSQEVGVITARPRLGALLRVLAVAALALAASASARPI